MSKPNPIRPTDEEARQLVRTLLETARFGALAVTDPSTQSPYVSRIATIVDGATPLILVSTLSLHTKALKADANCSLLIGEPGDKGDPLSHPRMTIMARAEQTDKAIHKDLWLSKIPKAQLYFDFTDFLMFRLLPKKIHLNGGFGKAYELMPNEFQTT